MKPLKHIIGVMLLSVVLLLPLTGGCSNSGQSETPFEAQDEYTAENPGHWEKIAPEHLPDIRFDKNFKGEPVITIRLLARHFDHNHFIEKIGLVRLSDKQELAVKSFERGSKDYTAEFEYRYDDDDIKVFVKCNLHDAWTVTGVGDYR